MVQLKGVKVTIVRHHDKQPYNEYKPRSKAVEGHRKAKTTYIEAVSGERFAVVVEILPGFNFRSSKYLQITAAIDESVESSWTIDAKDVNSSTSASSVENRKVVWDSEERLIDGKWNSYGLTFARLKIDNGAELNEEEIVHDREFHGRVTVTVARGTRVNCEPYVSPSVQKIEETPTSSRDLVVKHHISHTTKLIQLAECEPFLNTFKFNPVKSDSAEKGGPPIQFIFRARSKQSLRSLDIKSKRPVAPPGLPSAPGVCGIEAAAGAKSGPVHARYHDYDYETPYPEKARTEKVVGAKSSSVHARCDDDDDDEEPCLKKTKTETVAGARAVKLVFKRPHTPPQSAATEGNNGHNDPTAADATAVARAEPHSHPLVASNEVKHDPIVIKDEAEKNPTNASPAPREFPSEVQSQPDISSATSKLEDQARRERLKEILNNQLKQLKIEQQLLEMAD